MRLYKLIRFVMPLALLAVLMIGATGPVAASSVTVAPLTLVSGPSPFANCTVGATGAPGETLYVNAEEEPWVDANPTNPNNLIAVWQQDRWSNGGARGLATGVSFDGGMTWTTTYPHFSICAGGTARTEWIAAPMTVPPNPSTRCAQASASPSLKRTCTPCGGAPSTVDVR